MTIVGAALLAGVAPALQATNTDVGALLKDGSRGSPGRGVGKMSGILVVAQLAVTTGLLVPAGLMVKSVLQLDVLDHGLTAENVLTAGIALPNAASGVSEHRYPNEEARLRRTERCGGS